MAGSLRAGTRYLGHSGASCRTLAGLCGLDLLNEGVSSQRPLFLYVKDTELEETGRQQCVLYLLALEVGEAYLL